MLNHPSTYVGVWNRCCCIALLLSTLPSQTASGQSDEDASSLWPHGFNQSIPAERTFRIFGDEFLSQYSNSPDYNSYVRFSSTASLRSSGDRFSHATGSLPYYDGRSIMSLGTVRGYEAVVLAVPTRFYESYDLHFTFPEANYFGVTADVIVGSQPGAPGPAQLSWTLPNAGGLVDSSFNFRVGDGYRKQVEWGFYSEISVTEAILHVENPWILDSNGRDEATNYFYPGYGQFGITSVWGANNHPEFQAPQILETPLPNLTNTFQIGFTGTRLVVQLDIGLTGVSVGSSVRDLWEQGAESAWNGQFHVSKDGTDYPVLLDVNFVSGADADVVVEVKSSGGRSDALNWYLDDPDQEFIAAHEVGHLLGLYDEYPGGVVDPSLYPDGSYDPLEGDPPPPDGYVNEDNVFLSSSIMGSRQGAPKKRHYKAFLDWINGVSGGGYVLGNAPTYDSGDFGEAFEEGNLVTAALLGDYNDSGQVEQGDLDQVLQNWGQGFGVLPATWINHRPTEGIIDQAELDVVLTNWGNSTAPDFGDSTVPEPSTAVLLAATSLLFHRSVR